MTPDEHERLQALIASDDPRVAQRARILLLSADGCSADQICKALSVAPVTVYKWRARHRRLGNAGLRDKPRPGQPRKLSPERVLEVVAFTTERLPQRPGRWSVRSLARALEITEHQVRTIWAGHGLLPHQDSATDAARHAWLTPSRAELLALLLAPPFSAAIVGLREMPTAGHASEPLADGLASDAPAAALLSAAYSHAFDSEPQRASERDRGAELVLALATACARHPGRELHVLLACPTALDGRVAPALARPLVHAHVANFACHWALEVGRLLQHEHAAALRRALQAFANTTDRCGASFMWPAPPAARQRKSRVAYTNTADGAARQR